MVFVGKGSVVYLSIQRKMFKLLIWLQKKGKQSKRLDDIIGNL